MQSIKTTPLITEGLKTRLVGKDPPFLLQGWLKLRIETDSLPECLWFHLKPQDPEAHGFDSVSFSS